jgi:hypothetical protein
MVKQEAARPFMQLLNLQQITESKWIGLTRRAVAFYESAQRDSDQVQHAQAGNVLTNGFERRCTLRKCRDIVQQSW